MEDEDFYNRLGFVKSSAIRKEILELLNKTELKTPTEISKELNKSLNAISRALSELKDKSLVVCVNPILKVGRLYKITDIGKKVLE